MIVKSLKLKNFRNYDLLNLEFDSKTNIFYGDNAQGKTNLLEAIYFLGLSKSQRTSDNSSLIRSENNTANVKGILNKWQIAGAMDNGKTEAKQEEKPQERPPAYKVFDTNEPKKEKTQMPEELRRKIHEMF